MHIRPATPADLDRIRSMVATPSINTATPDVLDRNLALGTYRPGWMWLAEDDERLLGLAVWWGFADGEHPLALDGLFAHCFVEDCVGLWTRLLDASLAARPAGAEPPEYHVFLPTDWRDDPEITTALDLRVEAAAHVGLTGLTERLRVEWDTSRPVPQASSRLTFAPEPDDEVFVELFARASVDSLDAATRREVSRVGVVAAAREDVGVYRSMRGERSWWRVARDARGDVVGFALPSANDGGPVVGYLGVLPEHRGRGYVDDLLAEVTRVLVAAGSERVRADTDRGNRPMAQAFERAGWSVFATRLVISAPLPG